MLRNVSFIPCFFTAFVTKVCLIFFKGFFYFYWYDDHFFVLVMCYSMFIVLSMLYYLTILEWNLVDYSVWAFKFVIGFC
jgi:hypothetical protein